MNYNNHILIVDDVPDNIQVAMNILKEDNYAFSFAMDGRQALDLVESNGSGFDLILLDIMMPEIDGFEVCRQLKTKTLHQDVPVIFLSAKVDVESITQGFEVGGVDYITKPFHANELLARVKNHIQLYHSKKLLQQHNINLHTKMKFEHNRLLSELEANQKDIIYILTELMESTSDETGKHIKRVAEYCRLMAHYHDCLNDEDAEVLYHAAPMHDIGKMMVSQDILHKPDKLTVEEFNLIQQHTLHGHTLLGHSERKIIKAAAVIAYEHHEKWNGEGYPQGLKGEEIHIYGRITSIADVFDALTHKRIYKDSWAVEDAVAYIEQQQGSHFDPSLVALFLDHVDEFIAISQQN
ncbi:response regulator [Candidatus Venteria ishoeyi]|uniref:Cyclic di-GMP phosphodiesterase response regulator RpfG n=1 Tax=Candidatus Venteria ishoeyi TaxID=1899563 RepID=A0A1H6FFL3_9GAMM|nr:HD domain-containing phosphohydrolase [Candidatus Venteria ishoeyi]MDM8545556.1 response regulator [Candidatus Venteria ishoeyi]SEH08868.1 Cyclic di-GMP phosphodiesterase response regulator RpfG [Candidatus Venteria ishoeyi]